jgi:hypothetical protein
MTRILVTGSRDWSNPTVVEQAIASYVQPGVEIVIVHGGCRTGADAQADRFAGLLRLKRERYPAEGFGPWPAAGPIRNKYMVSLGADVCLAFIGRCSSRRCKTNIPHPSHGASLTANLAEAAGIPTRRYYA